jgi:hypothetical protein
MSHTPGPWGIQPDEHGGTSDTVYAYEDQQQAVAEIVSGVIADRHLIAAAPELLAALREVADGCARRLRKGKDQGDLDTLRLCLTAIAKAEGGE